MIFWVGYILFLVLAVYIDYKFFAGTSDRNALKKAIQSMSYWGAVTVASIIYIYIGYNEKWFNGFLSHDLSISGFEAIGLFISGYLLEQSLSIDNVFVIAFLMNYFQVPSKSRSSLLSIGIWSAIVLRGILIICGIWLISSISWMVYVLGILLIYTGIQLYNSDPNNPEDPNKSWIIKLIRKNMPVVKGFYGNKFFISKMGKWAATPLLLTLISIEITDILFALDSIPAIFALTTDPFIVMSSNILAVANLRALFVILSRVIEKLEYIHYALAVLLVLIGVKLLLSHYIEIPTWAGMIMIAVCLTGGVIFSLWKSSANQK